VSDADANRNGVPDCLDAKIDLCPDDANKTQGGTCGCGVSDADANRNGVPDCLDAGIDLCPNDPNKTQAGACGCGVSDADADRNGIPDCFPICIGQSYTVQSVGGPQETVGAFGCDLDKDGFSDAIYVNQLSGNISIYWGNAAGTLGTPLVISTGRAGGWGTCGDFTGDGKLDILITRQDSNAFSILPASGTRTFGAAIATGSLTFPVQVDAFDINADGKLDVLVRTGGTPYCCTSATGTWQLLTGKGDGTFNPGVTAFTSTASHRFGDLDGDGTLETIAIGASAPYTISRVGTNGALTTLGSVSLTGCAAPVNFLYLYDVNGDKRADLIANCNGVLTAYYSLGGLQFAPCSLGAMPAKCGSAGTTSCWPTALVDFNNDKRVDFLSSYTCGYCSSTHFLGLGGP
jgi:hypothetical protein